MKKFDGILTFHLPWSPSKRAVRCSTIPHDIYGPNFTVTLCLTISQVESQLLFMLATRPPYWLPRMPLQTRILNIFFIFDWSILGQSGRVLHLKGSSALYLTIMSSISTKLNTIPPLQLSNKYTWPWNEAVKWGGYYDRSLHTVSSISCMPKSQAFVVSGDQVDGFWPLELKWHLQLTNQNAWSSSIPFVVIV